MTYTRTELDGPVPIVPHIDAQILSCVLDGGALEMSDWHTCKTTHCLAGWAVVLAGDEGAKLEKRFSIELAAILIFQASRPNGTFPSFYSSNEEAMDELRRHAAIDPLPVYLPDLKTVMEPA